MKQGDSLAPTSPSQPARPLSASTPDAVSMPEHAPNSPADLFVSFTLLALQGFGGVMAIVQHELVERKRWLTKEEFVEEWAVAQIMPGPNVVNLSLMFGTRYFGLRGAMAAMGGLLTVPVLLILTLALAYSQFGSHPYVIGALRGMGAVAAGLIIGSGLKLLAALGRNPLGFGLCLTFGAVCFVGIVVLHVPLVYVLLGPGTLACVLAYRRIQKTPGIQRFQRFRP